MRVSVICSFLLDNVPFSFVHASCSIRKEHHFPELCKNFVFLAWFHLQFYLRASLFVCLFIFSLTRYGIGQHDSLWPVGWVHSRECERSSSEETSSPEWEEIHQSDPPGSLFCRHRQETFWPSLAWEEWWDKLWHPIFANASVLTALQYVTVSVRGKEDVFPDDYIGHCVIFFYFFKKVLFVYFKIFLKCLSL